MDNLIEVLIKNSDEKFANFQRKLLPTVQSNTILGVKTPFLKNLVKNFSYGFIDSFTSRLPHFYFEENQLHAFIISKEKNFEDSITLLEKFLPFIDNWATCDQTSPKTFSKNKHALLPYLKKWLNNTHTYTKRFAIISLMRHFLDENFDKEIIELVTNSSNGEYYVDMAISWFMQVALVKQWNNAITYLLDKKLSKFIQNKTIQKSIDSFRLKSEQKYLLKSLKL